MAKWQKLNDRDYFHRGLQEVSDNLNKEIAKIRTRTRRGLVKAAYHIAGRAAERAPLYVGDKHQGGNLRGSVRVRRDTINGEIVPETAVAGLPNDLVVVFEEKYAATQHEHVEFDHKEGEAKYLENTLIDEQDRLLKIIGGVDNA